MKGNESYKIGNRKDKEKQKCYLVINGIRLYEVEIKISDKANLNKRKDVQLKISKQT